MLVKSSLNLGRVGVLCCFLAAFATGPLSADQHQSASLEDEIKGFVVDYTITGIGHDFARFLAQYQATNHIDVDYNLTVKERPSARWGSLIWVESNHHEFYRIFIQPGRNNVKQMAEQAAQQIHARVLQKKVENMLMDTFDIDQDEF